MGWSEIAPPEDDITCQALAYDLLPFRLIGRVVLAIVLSAEDLARAYLEQHQEPEEVRFGLKADLCTDPRFSRLRAINGHQVPDFVAQRAGSRGSSHSGQLAADNRAKEGCR